MAREVPGGLAGLVQSSCHLCGTQDSHRLWLSCPDPLCGPRKGLGSLSGDVTGILAPGRGCL